jgi:predicted DNA-binding WGR domain protein
MPRYEFSEGSSNKFWQIDLKGKSFTTTYGKIGASGSTSLKEYGSEAEAKKEYDKLVAEKTKKGYELVGGGGGSAADDDDDDDEAPPPPKKAAAKAAPAKAAPAPAKAAAKPAAKPAAKKGGGARLFEFVEGSSSKFWEITMDGTDVKTRYGKIGTDGQTTLKSFDDAAGAQKEYDKLVKEKTKKGYEEK